MCILCCIPSTSNNPVKNVVSWFVLGGKFLHFSKQNIQCKIQFKKWQKNFRNHSWRLFSRLETFGLIKGGSKEGA